MGYFADGRNSSFGKIYAQEKERADIVDLKGFSLEVPDWYVKKNESFFKTVSI